MNSARIVVLGIALVAGGIAAFLASGSEPPPPAAVGPAESSGDVLVAKTDLALGQTVSADDMQWQDWPNASSGNFIRRQERPEALNEFAGYIVRSRFVAGEPIRESKLVKGTGSGFMAAILPSGMRAVSTEISTESGAGGFILPNDRVDVIQSRRQANPGSTRETIISEILLENVRVLAIDQQIEEQNGQKSVSGPKTATLELSAVQAEKLARARFIASGAANTTLSLALRSIADANISPDATRESSSGVNIVRRGFNSTTSNK
jgi:pilus assembly protein CpaB